MLPSSQLARSLTVSTKFRSCSAKVARSPRTALYGSESRGCAENLRSRLEAFPDVVNALARSETLLNQLPDDLAVHIVDGARIQSRARSTP